MSDKRLSETVSERYARAAETGEQMCCPSGYDFEELRRFIPEEVLKISYGCGTPAGLETVRPGETVLDIGSGGGIDCFEASRRVGPTGHVIGLDMTDTMLTIARRHAPIVAANLGYPQSNVEFRKAMAEDMPVEGGSIDLIISNCVINLAPDKNPVFQEMFRVLKPGGRFTISDIVSDQPVPNYLRYDTDKWGDCLSGALQVGVYLAGMVEAGFLGIHQVKATPWQVIDGIRFLSITLTGYKLAPPVDDRATAFVTFCGPFSAITDELGQSYVRGRPRAVNARTATLLSLPPLAPLFVSATTPITVSPSDVRFSRVLPDAVSCVWQGDYAILAGPCLEAHDDDGHLYRRGQPVEICSKTRAVLDSPRYRPHFTFVCRASGHISEREGASRPDGCC